MLTYCPRVFRRRRVAAKHMLPDTGLWRSSGTGPRGPPPGASRTDLERRRHLRLHLRLREIQSETILTSISYKCQNVRLQLH